MASLEVPIWHTKNTHAENMKELISSFFFKESGDNAVSQIDALSSKQPTGNELFM